MRYEKAKQLFVEYLEEHDKTQGKIKLKEEHTFRVVDISEKLATALTLDEKDVELAKTIALLHDIGRFDQAKLFDNLKDAETFDHAEYAVELLEKKSLLEQSAFDQEEINVILTAIKNHNKYKIESNLGEKELLHTNIIRDADKIDILNIVVGENLEKTSKKMAGVMTDKVLDDFLNNKPVDYTELKTRLDIYLNRLAFAFDINYKWSLIYIRNKGYMDIIIDKMRKENSDTDERIDLVGNHIKDYLNQA